MLLKGGASSGKGSDEEGGGGGDSNSRVYKRYKLSDEKVLLIRLYST
jgi:hypothetical protein